MQEVPGHALLQVIARVQAHPSRRELQARLLQALAPLPTEIFEHSSDPPDPWTGYKRCLSDLPECSHVLIIQDDALPCRNFAEGAYQIAQRYPTLPVCLFMGAAPASAATKARRLMQRGVVRYIPLGPATFVPLVAVLWPREKAQEFLHWSGSARTTRADDGNCARWMIRTKQQFMVAIPSLVQHDDFVPSVKGGRDHVPGKESWRQAVFLAEDALQYEW